MSSRSISSKLFPIIAVASWVQRRGARERISVARESDEALPREADARRAARQATRRRPSREPAAKETFTATLGDVGEADQR